MSLDFNPYEVSGITQPVVDTTIRCVSKRSLFAVGAVSILGIAVAGGVFGLFAGLLGFIVGFILALITGVPVTLVVFVLLAIFGGPEISKGKVVCAAAASGALTGTLSSGLLFGFDDFMVGIFMVGIAALLGSAGAAILVALHLRAVSGTPRNSVLVPDWGNVQPPGEPFAG